MDDSARNTTSTRTDRSPLAASRRAMLAWLVTADARAAARAELHRAGLDGYDADDLLHDVAVRLLQADLAAAPDNPVAYARRAIGRRAIDLLRGDLVRRANNVPSFRTDDDGDGDKRDPLTALADGDADPSESTIEAAIEDGIRRALHLALSGTAKVWAVAAALTTLTLRIHPEVALPDDAPRPEVIDDDKADRWAALWLAGEVEVFPSVAEGRPDDPARRQARSRKLRTVDELLRSIAASVLGGDDDG